MDVFDIVGERFFSILHYKDKRLNYILLMEIKNFIDNEKRIQLILKETIIEHLTKYFLDHKHIEVSNIDGESISNKSAVNKAYEKFNLFRDTGWICEESVSNFKICVSFQDGAILMLDVLKKIVDNTTNTTEYTGYINSVYNLLLNFSYQNSTALLEQIKEQTDNLMNKLNSLNSTIRRFMTNLLKRTDLDEHMLFSTLLKEYHEQVIMVVFNNLKIKDNPNKYTDKIINILEGLYSEDIDALVINYIETKKSSDSKDSIRNYIYNLIDNIIDDYRYLDEFISIIDQKNNKYLKSVEAKLKFLINNEFDVEGDINNLLKLLKNQENSLENIINYNVIETITEASLYTPRFNKEKVKSIPIIQKVLTEDERKLAAESLFLMNLYSIDKINKFIIKILGDSDFIILKDIEIDNESFILIFLASLYAGERDVTYIVEIYDEIIEKNNYKIKNMRFSRR